LKNPNAILSPEKQRAARKQSFRVGPSVP